MAGFVKIALLIIAVSCLRSITAKPLAELLLKNNFDFAFKPLPFKPIAFIKEKWSPFGKFGIKHGLVKRDLDSIVPPSAPPVLLEKPELVPPIEHKVPLPIIYTEPIEIKKPAPVYEILDEHPLEIKKPAPFYEIPGKIPIQQPIPPPLKVIPVTHLPPIGPVMAPPMGPIIITPPPPHHKDIIIPKIAPIDGLNTNIYRDELIKAYLNELEQENLTEEKVPISVENDIVQEKPKEVERSPLVRGSRIALRIGNMVLDLLTQFFGPQIDQPITI